MPILSAQNSFKKGLAALVDDDPLTAVAHFREAIDIEEQRRTRRPTMRYLSYYGYCLARTDRPIEEAIRACKTAAEREPRNPDLLLNLGRVYLLAGSSKAARDAFDRGLRFSPGNLVLQRERARAERRLVRRMAVNPGLRAFRGLAMRFTTLIRPYAASP